MFARFCDGCGKQFNRYEPSCSFRYDIRAKVAFKDSNGEIQGGGVASLDFCPECYAKIEAGIDNIIKNLPSEFNAIVRPDRVQVIE